MLRFFAVFSTLISVVYCKTLYDFTLNDIQGNPVNFKQFRGKTLLIVNTASQCGQTDSHYKALKRLYDILSFREKFEILAFPSNDFGEQEPWDEKEIEEFVRGHFKADFPLFSKVKVTAGQGQEIFWRFIIEKSSITPSWNFQKYLFDSKGDFVQSWDSNSSIESIFEVIQEAINNASETPTNNDKTEL